MPGFPVPNSSKKGRFSTFFNLKNGTIINNFSVLNSKSCFENLRISDEIDIKSEPVYNWIINKTSSKNGKSLKLDGVYIPSYNKLANFKNLNSKKNFIILGSAHNKAELVNKENQGCEEIFIAPIFKTKKQNFYLDIIKFNLIIRSSQKKIIALGGINSSNFCRLKSARCDGFASISWIKKNRPKKIGRFYNFKCLTN